MTETFSLEGREHVALHNLLKFLGWCDSGGEAKQVIADGEVTVDDQIELRKRCKILAGQQVKFAKHSVTVTE